jgi:pimeloyl-ACP methyl ester carboxylesterase
MKPEISRHRLRHRARPLDVLVAGEGDPLLLLHGWGLSGRAYRGSMLSLAARGWRVVAPSIAVDERWSIERAADTAAEAMAGLDAAPGPIVGHSFGGAIGAQLVLNHPDFASAIVAVNSPLVSIGSIRMGRIILPGQHYRIVGHAPAAVSLLRSAMQNGGLGSLARSARWFLGSGQERTLRALAEMGVPRAVVWAEKDALLPIAIGEKSAEELACELIRITADASWPGRRPPDHDWPFREPDHFAETVDTIIRKLLAVGR